MQLRNSFLILLSLLCCLPTQVTAKSDPQTTTIGLTTLGIITGAVLCSVIAEKTKTPVQATKEIPHTLLKTRWQKIQFAVVKHLNFIRTALYIAVGATSGALIGMYAANAFTNIKEPTLQDKLEALDIQLRQEQYDNTQRFKNTPATVRASFNKEEQALYLSIKKELTTPFEDLQLEPRDQDVFKEMEDRLKAKILTKYEKLKEPLKKAIKTEQQSKSSTEPDSSNTAPECPVCMEKINTPVSKYQCNHQLCTECFDGWRKQPGGDQCPTCRKFLK